MSELFITVLNTSLNACWLIAAVCILRLCLKKAPKRLLPVMWGLVGLRLLPFSFKSVLSLVPSAEIIPQNIQTAAVPQITTGIEAINERVNPLLAQTVSEQPYASANPIQIIIETGTWFWLAGIAVMLIYAFISCLRLRHKLSAAVKLRDNIFQSEHVASPFVFGFFKPKIYIPYGLDETNLACVLAHENAHLQRKDHWVKPLAWTFLCVHWFNPLLWLSYTLLCKDIELACDEKVAEALDEEQRKTYSETLLCCSIHRSTLSACPIAFGETSIKARIKSVMNYKKSPFWMIAISLFAVFSVSVFFLPDPVTADPSGTNTDTADVHVTNGDADKEAHSQIDQLLSQAVRLYIPQHEDARIYSTAAYEVFESGGITSHTSTESLHGEDRTEQMFIYTLVYIGQYQLQNDTVEQTDERFLALYLLANMQEDGNHILREHTVLADGDSLQQVASAFSHGIPEDFSQDKLETATKSDAERFFGFTEAAPEEGSTVVVLDEMQRIYVYRESGDIIPPSLFLFEDNTFQLTFGALSSYIAIGTYTLTDTELILKTNDGLDNKYTFLVNNNTFVFNAALSSVVAMKAFPDQAVFY